MAYRQKEYNYNDKLTKDQNLLMDKLYKMRMSGMAEAFENQLMNPNSGLESFETRFSEIINHEWSGRENKKFNRLLKQATLKYPAADLDSSLYDPERQLTSYVTIPISCSIANLYKNVIDSPGIHFSHMDFILLHSIIVSPLKAII